MASFSEVRISAEEGGVYIPFCVDRSTWSNGLQLPSAAAATGNLRLPVARQRVTLCQFHAPTSTVLGIRKTCWRVAHASLAGSRFSVQPPQQRATGDRWRAEVFELSASSMLLVSRVDPHLIGLRLSGVDDSIVVLLASTAAEAMLWVAGIAKAIADRRSAGEPLAALLEVSIHDSAVIWPLRPSSTQAPALTVRRPSTVSCTATFQTCEISDGLAAVRSGLPASLVDSVAVEEDAEHMPYSVAGSRWELRRVEIEWAELIAYPHDPLLYDGGDVAPSTMSLRTLAFWRARLQSGLRQTPSPDGVPTSTSYLARRPARAVRINFFAEEVRLYACEADPALLVVLHGPSSRILLLRAESADLAQQWGMDIASCIAASRGEDRLMPRVGLRLLRTKTPRHTEGPIDSAGLLHTSLNGGKPSSPATPLSSYLENELSLHAPLVDDPQLLSCRLPPMPTDFGGTPSLSSPSPSRPSSPGNASPLSSGLSSLACISPAMSMGAAGRSVCLLFMEQQIGVRLRWATEGLAPGHAPPPIISKVPSGQRHSTQTGRNEPDSTGPDLTYSPLPSISPGACDLAWPHLS